MKGTKDSAGYYMGIAGVLLLVAAAFLAPTLVFRMQDKMEFQRAGTAKQEPLDVVLLNAEYEPEVGTRLQNFAQGLSEGRQYRVAEVEKVPSGDSDRMAEIFGSILYQEWMEPFYETGMADYGAWFYEPDSGRIAIPEDSVLKKYVVYEEDSLEEITLMLWYLRIPCGDGVTLEVLTDAVEEYPTIYYLRAETVGGTDYEQYNSSFAWRYFAQYQTEMYYYYQGYYGTDTGKAIEIMEKEGKTSLGNGAVLVNGTLKLVADDEVGTEVSLPYGGAALCFQSSLLQGENSYRISAGIREIAALVPELQ